MPGMKLARMRRYCIITGGHNPEINEEGFVVLKMAAAMMSLQAVFILSKSVQQLYKHSYEERQTPTDKSSTRSAQYAIQQHTVQWGDMKKETKMQAQSAF